MRFFFVVLLLTSSALAQELFLRQSVETKKVALAAQVRERVKLFVALEVGSSWESKGYLDLQLKKTNAILAQCGVGIHEVEITRVTVTAAAQQVMQQSNPYLGVPELQFMRASALPSGRPLGLLFAHRSFYQDAAAFPHKAVENLARTGIDHSALAAVFYVTERHATDRLIRGATASYSTFAHELVHVIADAPEHNLIHGNLMTSAAGVGAHSGALTQAQCDAIVKELARF